MGAREAPPRRCLIVNADDFGHGPGVNRGVIEAHRRGIVTSASLMVRRPGAAEGAQYAGAHPELSLGLHVDIGEWAHHDDGWIATYEVVPPRDEAAVAGEVSRQLAAFRRLVGREPTHLDSHQHVHRSEPVRSILVEVVGELAVPLRGCTPGIRYCGAFYGQTAKGLPTPEAITARRLVEILGALRPGVTELGCHPGDGSVDDPYGHERAQELRALCDPRVREAIAAEGILLRSFLDVSLAPR